MSINSIQEIFDAFNSLKVLVIGDSMIDTYLTGTVERMSPEAPVPIVNLQNEEHRLGGAANVAINLKSLGAQVSLATILGDDILGREFVNLLHQNSIEDQLILKIPGRPTTQKERVMSGMRHLLRIDREDSSEIDSDLSIEFWSLIQPMIKDVDAVVIEDYDKGALNGWLIEKIVTEARTLEVPVCVDPKFRNFSCYEGVALFKPNLVEFERAMNVQLDLQVMDGKSMEELRVRLSLKNLMVTLGAAGVYYHSETHSQRYETNKRAIADVSGAGDTVMAIASLTYVMGLSPNIIAELSNLGGGIVCESPGVVPIDKTRFFEEALKTVLL